MKMSKPGLSREYQSTFRKVSASGASDCKARKSQGWVLHWKEASGQSPLNATVIVLKFKSICDRPTIESDE